MALSRIWSAFIIIAILVAGFKFIAVDGNQQIFTQMVIGKNGDSVKVKELATINAEASLLRALDTQSRVQQGQLVYKKEGETLVAVRHQKVNGIIETCKDAVTLCLGLIGVMTLFMGIMTIAEKAGGIRFLSRIIGPFFSKIFPDVPKDHPAHGHMMMNFSANLLGLDNAATPFGIKAMESLQELNPVKERASNAQIMFLCLHASGLTLIPVAIIAVRAGAGARNATDIFVPCMIATFVATMAALIVVSLKQRIRLLQPVILAWVLSLSVIIGLFVWYLTTLNRTSLEFFSGAFGNGLLLLIILAVILGGVYKKIDIFSSFIEGAKGGFETAVRIIPYLVGMLVAISMLRVSGTFDYIIEGMKNLFAALGTDTRFVDGLPTALVKPFSGGAARGMMVDTMTTYGADSFAGRLASILQGSSDTTFYVVAVYFGAVNIKNTRYAIGSMLLADLAGIITAIAMAYIFFG
ncbi:MAG TPA: nucleoside recognition domain-containing protein [Chitinophagaceae bacterium]|jgi:spore maturation protein SpmA|nr:nucleoside recognition domain-containing protein [Chitinophagaceae bacterium]